MGESRFDFYLEPDKEFFILGRCSIYSTVDESKKYYPLFITDFMIFIGKNSLISLGMLDVLMYFCKNCLKWILIWWKYQNRRKNLLKDFLVNYILIQKRLENSELCLQNALKSQNEEYCISRIGLSAFEDYFGLNELLVNFLIKKEISLKGDFV